MSVDPDTFRYALGHFASGVTVVTASAGGRSHGTTVSAFCSVSLDPPLVLICMDRRSTMVGLIERAGAFVVNVLRQDQELVARHFSSLVEDRLSSHEHTAGFGGQPVLKGVLVSLECRYVNSCDGGDHLILIGEVVQASVEEGQPLLYYRGGYGTYSS